MSCVHSEGILANMTSPHSRLAAQSSLDQFGTEGVLIVELANRREKIVSLVTNFVNQIHERCWVGDRNKVGYSD